MLHPQFLLQLATLVALLTSNGATSTASSGKHPQKFGERSLCLDPSSGSIVALAIDEESYASIPGSQGHNADDSENSPLRDAQEWKLVYEGSDTKKEIHGSFEGQFLQVLPDDGRTYPHRGERLTDVSQLDGIAPYLSFSLKIQKSGWYTLFIRWTGGDDIGGGDSFYVTLMKKQPGKTKRSADPVVRGQRTLKPASVPINTGIATYAGCCYKPKTHACPCFKSKPPPEVCNSTYFIDRDRAAGFGAQCLLGPGMMTIVPNPQWYLFAGQDVGNVMDFDSQPWDATCEAEGSNTADSGHDFPSWDLSTGDYELRIYAREDGTAFDAFYLAGPDAEAPSLLQRYKRGDSTFCIEPGRFGSIGSSSTWMTFFLFSFSFVTVSIFLIKTDRGRALTSAVSIRVSSLISGRSGDRRARTAILQYERMEQLYEQPTQDVQNQLPIS